MDFNAHVSNEMSSRDEKQAHRIIFRRGTHYFVHAEVRIFSSYLIANSDTALFNRPPRAMNIFHNVPCV